MDGFSGEPPAQRCRRSGTSTPESKDRVSRFLQWPHFLNLSEAAVDEAIVIFELRRYAKELIHIHLKPYLTEYLQMSVLGLRYGPNSNIFAHIVANVEVEAQEAYAKLEGFLNLFVASHQSRLGKMQLGHPWSSLWIAVITETELRETRHIAVSLTSV